MNPITVHNKFDVKVVLELNGKGSIAEFLFTTPDSHCDIEAFGLVYSNDDFTAEIFEGVTTSNDGTPSDQLAINLHRKINGIPCMKIFSTPTVTNYGKRIWVTRTSPYREPSGINQNYSILPKPDTKYVWKITKNKSGLHFIDVDFWWNEIHSDIV